MHVEGAERRPRECGDRDQLAVVEREQEVGLERREFFHDVLVAKIGVEMHRDLRLARALRDRGEPELLSRRIGVRVRRDNVHPALQEQREAGVSDIRVPEHDDARLVRHRSDRPPYTWRMR